MKLKVKKINVKTNHKIVVLCSDDAKKIGVLNYGRVKIKSNKNEFIAIVDIAESKFIKPGEIGIFLDLNIKTKFVDVKLIEKPLSLFYIKKKLKGKPLNYNEYYNIIKDIVNDVLTDVEKTYFVSACYVNELTDKEVFYLTKAMYETGDILRLKGRVFDKHCIGGVAGNRTTPLIVSILAANDLIIPKTSSRSITSPAGTADTIEVLTNVELDINKMKNIIEKSKGCLVWGGGLNLAPSDDKIIKIEHTLSLDPEGQLLASILAKKKSVSSTDVLIDIPVGKDAKIQSMNKAKRLANRFIKIGKMLKMNVVVKITNGNNPIGRGIGPVLEMIDILKILRNESKDLDDLKNKALMLSAILLEKAGFKDGYKLAKQTLESGKAFMKFKEIIELQGGKIKQLKPGKFKKVIKFKDFGFNFKNKKIEYISNKNISSIAKECGAPYDKKAGIYLIAKQNQSIKSDDDLFILYSSNKERLNNAIDLIKKIGISNIYYLRS